jgi:hypothetical protein
MMKLWTVNRWQPKNILGRFERLGNALEKAEETIVKQTRIRDKLKGELKKMESTHLMFSSSDCTAEAGG